MLANFSACGVELLVFHHVSSMGCRGNGNRSSDFIDQNGDKHCHGATGPKK